MATSKLLHSRADFRQHHLHRRLFQHSGFAYDAGFFTYTGVDCALARSASGVDGPNGVYIYGGVPSSLHSAGGGANYWADVVFSPDDSSYPTPDLAIAKTHSGNFTQGQTGGAIRLQ